MKQEEKNKEELVKRLQRIRDNTKNKIKENIKYGAVNFATATILLGTPNSADLNKSREIDRKKYPTELLKPQMPKLNVKPIKPEDVNITPIMINVAPDNAPKPYYEFHNKVTNNKGKEIDDFADATKYSIWDITYMREVGHEENPVGVFRSFGGTMQYNMENASSMMMYALLNPKYEDIAKKFFNKRNGFNKARQNLEDGYNEYGNFVFHDGSKSRQVMRKFVVNKNEFKRLFEQEGLENASNFLEMQRAFASDTYTSFDKNGFNKILTALDRNDIKIEDVSWAVVGMWGAKHIASGGFIDIDKTLIGKNLEQINSVEYLDELKNTFPSTFKRGSGLMAYDFAKEHYQEANSITTMFELSQMAQKPDIYENYLKLLSKYQHKNLSRKEALDLEKNKGQTATNFNTINAEPLFTVYRDYCTR